MLKLHTYTHTHLFSFSLNNWSFWICCNIVRYRERTVQYSDIDKLERELFCLRIRYLQTCSDPPPPLPHYISITNVECGLMPSRFCLKIQCVVNFRIKCLEILFCSIEISLLLLYRLLFSKLSLKLSKIFNIRDSIPFSSDKIPSSIHEFLSISSRGEPK